MPFEYTDRAESIRSKIALLDRLATTLLAAKKALVKCDIDALEAEVLTQAQLCAVLRDLDLAAARSPHTAFPQVPDSPESDELQRRLDATAALAMRRNTEFAAVLARSRRTIHALVNVMQTFEGDYSSAALRQGVTDSPAKTEARI